MEQLLQRLAQVAENIQKTELQGRIKLLVPVDKASEAAVTVREFGFDHVESVCGTDYPDTQQIEVAYFVGSVRDDLRKKVVILGSRIPRENPVFPTLTNVWKGAEYHERETWEMLGVNFQNHPKLAKILLPDDWTDIPPLRKDYHVKKWGAAERALVGLKVPGGNERKLEEHFIPSEQDLLAMRKPAFVETFLQAAVARDVDPLGRQLYEAVQPDERTMAISFGVQHPGSGHMRLVLGIDGDYITSVEPDIGYVHRGEEKMCEYKNYFQNIPHLERPVILDSSGILFPYILAAEDIMELTDKLPERAKYLRMIMAEFNRIISHMYWLGIMGIFTGHSTMFMWAMGDREMFIELAGLLAGARVTFAYFVPGGVRNDSPPGFEERVLEVCDRYEKRLDEYGKIFFENSLFLDRTKGVGVLGRQDAIDWGTAGPPLRASGVRSDTRKDEPYSLYDTIDFEIPSFSEGDSYARCMVSYLELYQSVKIIRQAVKAMKPGPVKVAMRGALRVKEGEAYARTEAAHGGMSYYIVSKGKPEPYRVRISVPSFRNLLPLVKKLLPGQTVADVPVIHWSLNYWAVEGDR